MDNDTLTISELTAATWRVALHESGHLLAAVALCGRRNVKAVLHPAGGGEADIQIGAIPRSLPEAVALAAGQAAESLADAHPAPPLTPFDAPLWPSTLAALTGSPTPPPALPIVWSDSAGIGFWAVQRYLHHPDRWADEAQYVRGQADAFCRRNAARIVEVATELYANGRAEIVLPEQTTSEEEKIDAQ